jgi:UDP-N-acetylglucosamine 2-epimerase (non-hydrolysing)
MERILHAIADFARSHPEGYLAFPVHPNPAVREPVRRILGPCANVHLVEPLEYTETVAVLKAAYLVLTDSGGLQEEAPAIGKPVLVFRDVTERPEAVAAGGAQLVGADSQKFRTAVERLWSDPKAYALMAQPRFPYGDGHAAERISAVLFQDLAGVAGQRVYARAKA